MKRILLVLAAVLLISGAAWGQALTALFDWMYADTAESVEFSSSEGIFTSSIDDYINVLNYDSEIGTFLFLGGNDTYSTVNRISLGFAKTLSNGYLGLYFGGRPVTATGTETGGDTTSASTWHAQLAVIYGTANMGAFRFDLSMFNAQFNENEAAETSSHTNAASIGLTWGGFQLLEMDAYVTLGIQFPDTSKTATLETTGTSSVGIQAGVQHENGFSADVGVLIGIESETKPSGGSAVKGNNGRFGFGVRAAYTQIVELEKFAFGFSPNAGLGFTNIDVNADDSTGHFRFEAGVDLGARYQLNDKFNLYTGAGLQFINFQHNDLVGDNSNWTFNTVNWDTTTLRFGLTFSPIENLVIGADISSFVNRFFNINIANMTAGTAMNSGGTAPTEGAWAQSYFSGLTFNLTVSYRFSGKASE